MKILLESDGVLFVLSRSAKQKKSPVDQCNVKISLGTKKQTVMGRLFFCAE